MSYTEITTMPLSRLTQLQKIKEQELETRSKNIKQLQQSKESPQMTVNNSGKRFKDKSK